MFVLWHFDHIQKLMITGDDCVALDPRTAEESQFIGSRVVDTMMLIYARQDELLGLKKSQFSEVILRFDWIYLMLSLHFYYNDQNCVDVDVEGVAVITETRTTKTRKFARRKNIHCFSSLFMDALQHQIGEIQARVGTFTSGNIDSFW